jgi:hypothetical protein
MPVPAIMQLHIPKFTNCKVSNGSFNSKKAIFLPPIGAVKHIMASYWLSENTSLFLIGS